jgi:hypothetical protein
MFGRTMARILLDAGAGDGGGSGGGGSGDLAAIQAEVRRQVNAQNGDAISYAVAVLADKERIKAERDELAKKLPPADSVVLSKADAERWEAYRKLGKPDELGAAVAERDTLKRTQSIRDAAEAGGYKPGPLGKLIPADAEISVKDGKGEKGEATRTPEITVGGKAQPLAAYLESEFGGDILSALKADGKAAETRPAPKGTPPPRDDSRERPKPGEKTDKEADPRAELLANPAYASLL